MTTTMKGWREDRASSKSDDGACALTRFIFIFVMQCHRGGGEKKDLEIPAKSTGAPPCTARHDTK
jgi:hypothetical protein